MADEEAACWSLHPQLARDGHALGDLPLSRVLLASDANYPWLILVPRRPRMVEIIDLAAAERMQLMEEIVRVSQALKSVTRCDKLNVAALGNVVAQLHVHVIARFRADAAGAHAVWGKAPTRTYDPGELQRLTHALRAAIGVE